MHPLIVLTATALLGATAHDNPVFRELTEQGVRVSGGGRIQLPPPTMPDGLDAAAQEAVLKKIAQPRYTLEEFVRNSQVAPILVDVRSADRPGADPPALADFWCVMYGDWSAAATPAFLESLLQPGPRAADEKRPARGYLTSQDLAKRNIQLLIRPDVQSRIFYTRDRLFDRVEWATTRYTMVSGNEHAVLLAVALDSRFDHDPEYPNQWRSLDRDETGKLRFGPPQPYAGVGFYAKATRLARLEGAIFLEYHMVLDEPHGWFNGANFLRSKIPLAILAQVHLIRWKLAGTQQSQ